MLSYFIYMYVTIFISFISNENSVGAADGDTVTVDSRTCNTTTGAGCPPQDSGVPSFLLKVVVIAGSIAGIMVLLSLVVCVCYCIHNRKSKGLLEVEAATEFEQSEDPQVYFRRVDNTATNRMAASVFSWGSEFSVDADRKGNYENPEVIEMVRLNRKSNNQIYANTSVGHESSLPQDETSFSTSTDNQYANVSQDLK